ncbi:galactokinase [Rossellomorea marisflavi]|uniref:galactokinase n=1 Tax=Rossellomorea marisflavi TaxID=189381 RepID=UPI00203FCC7A|nr:galactokinase [Rossellomorea marisflavi]MCM2606385.1 galactokinase [Rossellomorea marisflavi]
MKKLTDVFGGKDKGIRTFFAPGRVNLIGEHTDYTGGLVLPCALGVGTYVSARENGTDLIRLFSENFPEAGIIEVPVYHLAYDPEDGWANYPKGIFHHLLQGEPRGMDLYYQGNIPNGAGLSSSASIEIATAVMVNEWYSLGHSTLDLVLISQEVENRYIGVNCGIMDQFAVGFGKAQRGILLDCGSLKYDYIPLPLEGISIVIANSNVRRELAGSAYNERRKTCEDALLKLEGIASLGELTPEDFSRVMAQLSDEEARRVRHVVTENDRTRSGAELLRNGDIYGFGQLMKESHESLRVDYEVTGDALDALVDAAWQHHGTIGARMTGAGFGGCTVNLVAETAVPSFIQEVGSAYEGSTGRTASFYVVKAGAGASEVTPIR